ncbi:MAG TPA: hypothetical protein VGV92_00905 [Gammaproteobacteria bacterium]|nr:hypothetical protein [Gammaproteobacteria bacterium]
MKFAVQGLVLVCFVAVLAGCHHRPNIQWFPPAKNPSGSKVNCVELKRQQLYNQTNMNTETNNTLQSQRDELDALIAKNCQ